MADKLEKDIRGALGEYNDDTKSVLMLMRGLVAEAECYKAENHHLQDILEDCEEYYVGFVDGVQSAEEHIYGPLRDENKRLRNFIECELDHARAFVGLVGEPEKDNQKGFINRCEAILYDATNSKEE